MFYRQFHYKTKFQNLTQSLCTSILRKKFIYLYWVMKIFIPRNISGGWLNMSVNVGPANITIVQLMILALGLGLMLAIWNVLVK